MSVIPIDLDGSRENRDLQTSPLAGLLLAMGSRKKTRKIAMSWALKHEGGDFRSSTRREILRRYHAVEIGAYSYGACFEPGAFPPNTTVGRFVSTAPGVRAFGRNHPYERLSMHPYFYNRQLGYVDHDTIESGELRVGHDAWLGERSILTPGCRRVGIGAIVGAGAVVTRAVPDFAIVAGNPAKVIKMRFDDSTCAAILASCWWEKSIEDLAQNIDGMLEPVADASNHPLLKGDR